MRPRSRPVASSCWLSISRACRTSISRSGEPRRRRLRSYSSWASSRRFGASMIDQRARRPLGRRHQRSAPRVLRRSHGGVPPPHRGDRGQEATRLISQNETMAAGCTPTAGFLAQAKETWTELACVGEISCCHLESSGAAHHESARPDLAPAVASPCGLVVAIVARVFLAVAPLLSRHGWRAQRYGVFRADWIRPGSTTTSTGGVSSIR